MRNLYPPIDVNTYARNPASLGPDTYILPQTLPQLTVGVVARRLTLQRTPCFLCMPQADNINTATICIGGPNVTILNGIELLAGQAFLLSTMPTPQQQMLGNMGIGITQQVTEASAVMTYMLFDMYDIWVVAAAADQSLRVMYMSAPRSKST